MDILKGIYNKDNIFNNYNELSLAIWLMDDGLNKVNI